MIIQTLLLMQELFTIVKRDYNWTHHNKALRYTTKSIKKYMKCWRSKLARLNKVFDTYIKENYKVQEYAIKKLTQRRLHLTWRPYGYYKRCKKRQARRRCIFHKGLFIIEAKAAVQKKQQRMEFDTDSYDILIDNCCTHSLTNCKEDFIEPPTKSRTRVRGYNGQTNSTMVGTVKWKIADDNGKVHSFVLPNTYYSPAVETRLLSPQHWAQVRNKKRDSYCITYHDAIILRCEDICNILINAHGCA